MSFLDKAKQAAEQARRAAEGATHVPAGGAPPTPTGWGQPAPPGADEATPAGSLAAGFASHSTGSAAEPMNLSSLGAQFKDAASKAKSGLVTAIEKIDPAILADIIIKSTAIQETANRALKAKGSVYRIGEVTITATIPPQIGFAINRIGDVEEEVPPESEIRDSRELLAADPTAASEQVVSLEGDVRTD
jgi:hypothetical protein